MYFLLSKGRRHYEVSLRTNSADGQHFVMIKEYSNGVRSSILLSADDVALFLSEFTCLGNKKDGETRGEERS